MVLSNVSEDPNTGIITDLNAQAAAPVAPTPTDNTALWFMLAIGAAAFFMFTDTGKEYWEKITGGEYWTKLKTSLDAFGFKP